MSNLVLYRKYRPQKFAEVINQEHVKTTLQNAVTAGRVGHAYLFTGPRGVGKTTMARIFARAINCPNRQGAEPCNECAICQPFLNGSSLDLLEIDAASHTGVDNVRELIDHLQFAPTQGQYKVIIIDEVHMLSRGAFNALLKTLEEPPRHAVFILATTEIQKLPATIISRTQRFDFKRVSVADLIKLLKFVCDDNKVQISPEALLEVAVAADGGFRDGLSLLDQVINYASGEITEELVEQVLGLTGIRTVSKFLDLIIKNKTKPAVGFIGELLYSGKDLYQFGKDFLEYLRKVLLTKVGVAEDFGLSAEFQQLLQSQAAAMSLARLKKIIEAFQKAEAEIKWAAIPSLPLELAVIESVENIENNSSDPDKSGSPPLTLRGGSDAAVSPPLNIRGGGGELPQSDGTDTLSQIISHWPQILEKVKEYNHSLISSLKLAQPVAVIGKDLILLFPYKFHKDAIDARKNRIVVDQAIEEVCGIKLQVKATEAKEWKNEVPVVPTAGGSVESALKIMGGEVEA